MKFCSVCGAPQSPLSAPAPQLGERGEHLLGSASQPGYSAADALEAIGQADVGMEPGAASVYLPGENGPRQGADAQVEAGAGGERAALSGLNDKLASLFSAPEMQRNALLAALGILVAGTLLFWMIHARTEGGQVGSSPAENPPVVLQEYATRTVVVRNIPTTIGSQEITRLARGEALQGSWVTGSDGIHQWLKLAAGPYQGDYISAVNLSLIPRPDLVRAIDQDMRLAQPGQLFATTTPGEAPIDALAAGSLVHVVGEVNGGWMEIERRFGGVGYIPSIDFDTPGSGTQDQPVPH